MAVSWQCKGECGTTAQFRFHPDPPAISLHDFLTDGQPDSAARIFAAMQPLEQSENLLLIVALNSDAVVGDRNLPHRAVGLGGDKDVWRLVLPIFERVADQVLKQLGHM